MTIAPAASPEMESCAHCEKDYDLAQEPGDVYRNDDGEFICHDCIGAYEMYCESCAEDRRLDDPRHGQAKELNRSC